MKTLSVADFKQVSGHGALIAFLSIETPSGLLIRDCRLFEKSGRKWVGLPSRQYTKSDGSTAYAQIVEFSSKEVAARFQDEAIRAIDAYLVGGSDGAR
jgi:hypothetical protein